MFRNINLRSAVNENMPTLVQNLVRIGDTARAGFFQRKQSLTRPIYTVPTYARDKCVHRLFEREVERRPEATAIVAEGKQFTFAELNARANQLARFLKRFGVGPDSLVGLCVDRSPEMIVGILGVLKAGAGYVPLDPTYPHDRLSSMMQEADIFVLLTQAHLLDSLPQHKGPRLSLDSDWGIIAKERPENVSSQATTENPACVIYTSGPTRNLRGVVIPHRGLVNYLRWCAKAYEVARRCGAPVYRSSSFDWIVASLLSSLMVGRRVVLIC
jgi:non-ribosomal peptide synthetase component F